MLDSRYVWRGSRQDLPAGGSIQVTPKNSHSGRSSLIAQGPRSSFKGLLNLCSHSCLSLGWERFTLLSPNRQGGHTRGKQSDRWSYGDGNPRVPSPECSKGLQWWQALSANKTDKGNFCRCISYARAEVADPLGPVGTQGAAKGTAPGKPVLTVRCVPIRGCWGKQGPGTCFDGHSLYRLENPKC